MTCNSWPVSSGYTCTDAGAYSTSLNRSMDTSQTARCESLCRQEGEDGCCSLTNSGGCFWKGGSSSTTSDTETGISVTCSPPGTFS